MKLLSLLLVPALVIPVLAAPAALSQAKPAATAPVKRATTPASRKAVTTVACAKLPDLSPKIPALPAGLPCARPLYTITTVPSVKFDYISPLEGPTLSETLGIEPTSFSLDYIDIKAGTGELAAPRKFYTIHYTGYLIDGTKFDSSVDRGEPITVAYGQHQVIPGWDTGFDGMRVGGKRRLFIPYQLAYGAAGKAPIPPKAELIFDVELISMSDTPPAPKPATPPPGMPGQPPPGAAQSRPAVPPGAPARIMAAPPPPRPPTARPTPDGTIPAPAAPATTAPAAAAPTPPAANPATH